MSHCGGRTRGRCVQFEFTPIPPMSLLFDSFGIPGSLSISIAFTQSLEDHGWSVDTEIEHPSGPPLEELQKTDQEDDELVTKQLQEFASEKKALILRNSHTGGHRYAGNCIVSKLFISSSFSVGDLDMVSTVSFSIFSVDVFSLLTKLRLDLYSPGIGSMVRPSIDTRSRVYRFSDVGRGTSAPTTSQRGDEHLTPGMQIAP